MFDDIGEPGEDARWDVFADFHLFLESRFPLMYVETGLYRFPQLTSLADIRT